MKIAILNNRYHVTGGPERYLFALEARLAERGHEPIPFSVRYAQNRPTTYSKYFANPPGGDTDVFYRDVRGIRAKTRLFFGGIYSRSARRGLHELIRAERPDVAFVLIVANFLSPSTLMACRDAGLPVVMRLSDFHLIAPCYHFFDGNVICERCMTGTRIHAVRKKCLQDSALVSLGRIAGMALHDRLGVYDTVARFVAPSVFLRDKMIESGLSPERIVHVPSFVDAPPEAPRPGSGAFFLYVGRLSREKGVDRLIEAHADAGTTLPLLIAGDVRGEEGERLRTLAHARNADVRFLGGQRAEDVSALISDARAVVVPSLCYENLPRVALEAMAAGRPVVTHRLGSLPEVVRHGETGFLCDPEGPAELSARLRELAADPALAERMGRNGWAWARKDFSPDEHVNRLLSLWQDVIDAA